MKIYIVTNQKDEFFMAFATPADAAKFVNESKSQEYRIQETYLVGAWKVVESL